MDIGRQSSTTSPSSGHLATRKERGAIAAQACETCRNRKQKCSEGRPKCSSCEKLQTPCVYRSPPVTKKDKTLVEILERLKSVEIKLDGLSFRETLTPPVYSTAHVPVYPTPAPLVSDVDTGSVQTSSATPTSPTNHNNGNGYRYCSSVAQLLQWPAIRQLIESLDGAPTVNGANGFLVGRGIQDCAKPIPIDGIPSISMPTNGSMSGLLHYTAVQPGIASNAGALDWDNTDRLSKAYFDTYNCLHPIMDRDAFRPILSSVMNSGLRENTASVLVLLVLALGEVSLTISSGIPVLIHKGRASGIKGGTIERPPGLAFFNEARKRMGFAIAEVSIENVQMFALAALFYDSCGRSQEYRRPAASASLACQALINNKPDELHGPRADLIRRLFWHCSIMETSLHMEFDTPLTGLDKLNDVVGMVDFSTPISDEDYLANQTTHFQEHFAAQVVLHRLSTGFHSTLSSTFSSSPSAIIPSNGAFTRASGDNGYTIIKHLSVQLDQWRGMLPSYLRWQDDQPHSTSEQDAFGTLYSSATLQMFTSNLDTQSTSYPYAGDIQTALLRTRYYYNKYLIHRPFIFRVLHYQTFTNEEAEGAAKCLSACLKWPIASSPPCLNKRILPLTVFWSQNIFGILVLLHLARQHPVLARVRTAFCAANFDFEASESMKLYIDWLRDIRKMDPVAERCWAVVRALYGIDE